jgi:hypothetical protein
MKKYQKILIVTAIAVFGIGGCIFLGIDSAIHPSHYEHSACAYQEESNYYRGRANKYVKVGDYDKAKYFTILEKRYSNISDSIYKKEKEESFQRYLKRSLEEAHIDHIKDSLINIK